ncbi:hypothetical protein C2S52_010829 [Perilla frutescens var. hirtella]|nr:hypothetical protein C2S52_010829 [Perilla frutescens var. hirtella]
MAENFVGVLEQECHREDFKALTNQIRDHESTMRLKRRWLMDLPLSDKEQKRIEELLPPNDKIMPESFLREDDVSYEDIRTCIKKAFGAHNSQREEPICVQDDATVLNLCDGFQEISFLLDAMTNKGLCSLARILIGGLDKFDKTNWRMKRLVKELLPKVIADKNDISKTKLKRCSLLLKDPNNFRGNEMARFSASESYRAAALTVLDEIKYFSSITLHAMHRKLKGDKGYIPTLRPQKSGGRRRLLINGVRNKCMKMLQHIGTVDEPAEQLAGALGIAGLTLKLIMNRPAVRDLRRFSPEMEALHNDIGKALHLLKEVSLTDLKEVLRLLVPEVEFPAKRNPRVSVQNLLIEYLYECSDMDTVPEVLIGTLDIINGRAQCRSHKKSSTSRVFSSSKELMKEEIEKEIEHVLNISAQAKEVVANLLPEHEFDEEFGDAYMEDFEESDTLCVFDDDQQMEGSCQRFAFRSNSADDQTESSGEINPVELNSSVSTSKRDGCLPFSPNKVNSEYQSGCTSEEVGPSMPHVSSHNEVKSEETEEQSRSANGYLDLQEACDNTSTVAYRFVGYMLDTIAMTEGIKLSQDDRLYLQNYTQGT